MGRGLVRCVKCGEVEWSLRGDAQPRECRVCGAEMRSERRRPGRRFGRRTAGERRDARPEASA